MNKADESSLLVPMKCLNKQNEILLFLVANSNSIDTFVFYLGVNFFVLVFMCQQQQFNIFNSWVFYDIHFSLRSFFTLKNENVQMFFEDCAVPS